MFLAVSRDRVARYETKTLETFFRSIQTDIVHCNDAGFFCSTLKKKNLFTWKTQVQNVHEEHRTI